MFSLFTHVQSKLLLLTVVVAVAYPATAYSWSYKEAAKPYAGTTINILDEVTPLQQIMAKHVKEFEELTGIKVNVDLQNHYDVIKKGQSDMLSGRGHYDGVMLHSAQMGMLLDAGVLQPISKYMKSSKLRNPELDSDDIMQPAWDSAAKYNDEYYGFLTWNYNQVYVARKDLFNHPDEQKAFKQKYGYELAPAETMSQMRDIAEFFTRDKGEKLAGKTLDTKFYGIVLEGKKSEVLFHGVWRNFINNWGGAIFNKDGVPTFDRKENIEAVNFWAGLWEYGPPGQAEYSLLDLPTVMGNGIAAQSLLYSDFMLGVDRPDASEYAGQFVYNDIPHVAGKEQHRSALGEPSIIAISTHSDNPEATFLYIQWLIDKKTQLNLAQKAGMWLPVRYSTWKDPIFQDSRYANLYSAMKGSLEVIEGKPRAPDWYEIVNIGSTEVQNVGTGNTSAKEAMSNMQSQVMDICNNCLLPEKDSRMNRN